MKVIHKYPLEKQFTRLTLHEDFKVLCAHTQNDVCTLWIEVDIDKPAQEGYFRIVGTGGAVPNLAHYVGTCFIDALVWHVYHVQQREWT